MAVVAGQTSWHWITTGNPRGFNLGSDITFGGRLICKSGGIAWIVAPSCSQVGRTWYCRNDAVTTACACTTSTTWFIPTSSQLVNPGYCCRVYWDSYSSEPYWSSTDVYSINGGFVSFTHGAADSNTKSNVSCVRAFRCVTY